MPTHRKQNQVLRILAISAVILFGFGLLQQLTADETKSDSEISKCEFHNIDADICARCNPELIPDFKAKGDWCAGHNVPESQCDLCDYGKVHEVEEHTNSTTAKETDHGKCEFHNIDADICARCNPELIPDFKAKGDWCAGHNVPESQCELCDFGRVHEAEEYPTLDTHLHENELASDEIIKYKSEFSVFFPENIVKCATDEAVIQLASIKTAERAGITIQQAIAVETSPYVEAPAEIVFDETKTAVVSTIIPALVSQWLVEPGQKVSKGDALARLTSPEIPELKARYLEAFASWKLSKSRYDRQKKLFKDDLTSESVFEESENEYAVADANFIGLGGMLKSVGLSDADLREIIEEKKINQNFNLYAPVDGALIERIAVPGQLLDEGNSLAIVGNPEKLWIEAQIREADISYFSVGDRIEFSADGAGYKHCAAKIIWIAQFLDKNTRSLTVRAEIESFSDFLHSGEYGRITLDLNEKEMATLVPKDAVQWEGCCNVVFVKEKIDRFRPRKVQIEPSGNGYYKVTEGLNPGEEIVVNGSYLLKTELRKGSIGAGCCGL